MERPWEIPAARTAPEWIIGPSCKRKRPDHDPPDPTLGRSPDRKRTRQQRNRQALHELDKRTKNSRILRSPAHDSESSSATKDNLLRNMTPTKALQKNA